ncbi:nitroreductase family protein [Alcanivorax hongdengensis A-11-3]|uniref:Putative NAD(P)H nitroreductase n=1 Tax=Alcanivorax hongdengensis A-11-3 TaxID=1177179 RepID=L0WD67_9GAMM|nr:nitroreductase [Alcanivorax hongdengensis]EKF74916.1 nitroreductase family protein [Alcanivorax hongdengensis A-11-3]
MDALTALTTRVSSPRLEAPGPSGEDIEQLLQAAIRAPDHGILRPWRFLVLQGEARHKLGDIMVEQLLAKQPDADERSREAMRGKALRAPTLIIAVAEITEGHKVPAWEQILAVGAAVQNMMVAAHAMGIGAMWRTGDMANSELAKARLGFAAKDQVVAYLYLGTPSGPGKPLPAENPADYLRDLP